MRPASMADADLIAVGGSLPTDAHQNVPMYLGVYKKQSERVNGRHTYVKVDDDKLSRETDAAATSSARALIGGIIMHNRTSSTEYS